MQTTNEVRLRAPAGWMIAFSLIAALSGAGAVTGAATGKWLVGVAFAIVAAVALSGLRLACWTTPQELVVRGPLRTTRYARADILAFETRDRRADSGQTSERNRVVVAFLRDGSEHELTVTSATNSFLTGLHADRRTRADDAYDALERWRAS